MKRHTGNSNYPVWLIGDSEPGKNSEQLVQPLDSRHPTRHNIWSPILLYLNFNLYQRQGQILDESKFYVRNAVGNTTNKPEPSMCDWDMNTLRSLSWFRKELVARNPILVFTFGSFAYEFLRRARSTNEPKRFGDWTTVKLGDEFRMAAKKFDINSTNVFPLLHASIARGHFLKAHENYTGISKGNYFTYVANILAGKVAMLLNEKII